MDEGSVFSRNQSGNSSPGNDFSNNLFTDLAPLLTLFGDQMTKQFLSMSMGWTDNTLTAICPIGILTVIVSAIRIGGTSRLKTLIGRARESRSTAELELLSATSSEVCEMWSGSEIVRVAGQPDTNQYILDKNIKPPRIMTLSEALRKNVYLQRSNQTDVEDPNGAPNLTLNVQDTDSLSWEILTLVVVGISIQVLAFVLSAVIVYAWSWRAGSNMISPYGFPCYLVGTVLLTLGLLGCAQVITKNSKVDELYPQDPSTRYQPICLQKACTVEDKHFLSYAIFHPEGQSTIKLSRSNGRDYNLVTLCSTVVALSGYVGLFIGLRAMHWSVALIQLAATLTMTCVRAFIRRGLANQPVCKALPMGTDAAGLAYLFCKVNAWEIVTGTSKMNEPTHATLSDVEDIDTELNMSLSLLGETAADPNPSNNLIMTAKSLEQDMATEHSISLLAQQLVNSIYAIMKIYSQRQANGDLDGKYLDCNEHCWSLQPLLQMKEGQVRHRHAETNLCSSLTPVKVAKSEEARESSALIADPEAFSAILSLWLAVLIRRYPMYKARTRGENEIAWQQPQSYRIISNDCVPQGVPRGEAIRKWLSSQTPVHTTSLRQLGQLPADRQAKETPMFGISFSSRYLRFRAVPDPYHLPFEETVADAVEPDVLNFADPSVSPIRAIRTLGQREYLHPSVTDEEIEDNDFPFLRGLTVPEMRAALRRTFRDGSTNRSTEAAVLSSSSLERSCALELITLFMLSLTGRISQIKGHTTKVTRPDGETWTNSVINEMATAVVQNGLAEDEAEALTLVVPTFAARGLLPTELSCT